MKLEDVVGARGHVFVGLVDRGQHIAVTGDFLFVAVAGLYPFLHQGTEAFVGGVDTFDPVGCAGTLDLGHFQEGGEDVRLGFDEELLPSAAFVKT